ncbi:MAG: hypothetical protein ABJV04_07970 [Aliiglaciecola sp.]|uniref:hypothetical protein n=1 Tax=Aliiglaciecola sp. TaxID=1872441 RepID=UPI00329934EE
MATWKNPEGGFVHALYRARWGGMHYWIEDNELNRVALFPHEGAALYFGESVVVEGHFSVSSSQGRRLRLTKIKSVLQPQIVTDID